MDRKITALKVQKRNKDRINVYLEGEFAFGVSKMVGAWLQVGQTLTDEKIEALKAEDQDEVAYQRALNYLSYRPRSVAEVEENLRKRDYSPETIARVVARLRRARLVDDRKFADLWVENRSTFRPRGRHALRMELRAKGIPEEIIQEALEEIDEEALAYQAASRKVRSYRNLEREAFRRKLGGYLSRRGFPYGVVGPVVDRLWQERDEEAREDGPGYWGSSSRLT